MTTVANYRHFLKLALRRAPNERNCTLLTNSIYWLVLLSALVLTVVSVFYFDAAVQSYIWKVHSKSWIEFFEWVSWFGKVEWTLVPAGLLVLVLAFTPFAWFKRSHKVLLVNLWQSAIVLAVPVIATGIVIQVLKQLLQRPRPLNSFSYNETTFFPLDVFSGFTSMPSGHAGTFVSSAIVLGVLFPLLRIPLVLAAVFIGFSRLALMNHYLADVIVGAAIAFAITVIYLQIFAHRRVGIVQTATGKLKPKPIWRYLLGNKNRPRVFVDRTLAVVEKRTGNEVALQSRAQHKWTTVTKPSEPKPVHTMSSIISNNQVRHHTTSTRSYTEPMPAKTSGYEEAWVSGYLIQNGDYVRS